MDIPEWVAFFTRPQWSEKYVSTTSTVPTKLRWQAPGASFEDGTLVSYDKNGFPYGITAFGIPAWDRSYLRSLAYGMLAASRDAGAGAGDKPRDGSECVPGEISVGDGGDSTTYKSVGNVHKQPTGSHQASEELNCIPCDDKTYRVTFGPEIPINMKTGQPLTVEARKITHNQFRSEFPFNDPEISSAALHLDRQEDIGSWIYRNDADLARSLANFAGYPMGSWKELRNSFSGPTRTCSGPGLERVIGLMSHRPTHGKRLVEPASRSAAFRIATLTSIPSGIKKKKSFRLIPHGQVSSISRTTRPKAVDSRSPRY